MSFARKVPPRSSTTPAAGRSVARPSSKVTIRVKSGAGASKTPTAGASRTPTANARRASAPPPMSQELPPTPESLPLGWYVQPTTTAGNAILSSPEKLRQRLTRYTPPAFLHYKMVNEHPFLMDFKKVKQRDPEAMSANMRVLSAPPDARDERYTEPYYSRRGEERFTERDPQEYWSSTMQETMSYIEEADDDDFEEMERQMLEDASADASSGALEVEISPSGVSISTSPQGHRSPSPRRSPSPVQSPRRAPSPVASPRRTPPAVSGSPSGLEIELSPSGVSISTLPQRPPSPSPRRVSSPPSSPRRAPSPVASPRRLPAAASPSGLEIELSPSGVSISTLPQRPPSPSPRRLPSPPPSPRRAPSPVASPRRSPAAASTSGLEIELSPSGVSISTLPQRPPSPSPRRAPSPVASPRRPPPAFGGESSGFEIELSPTGVSISTSNVQAQRVGSPSPRRSPTPQRALPPPVPRARAPSPAPAVEVTMSDAGIEVTTRPASPARAPAPSRAPVARSGIGRGRGIARPSGLKRPGAVMGQKVVASISSTNQGVVASVSSTTVMKIPAAAGAAPAKRSMLAAPRARPGTSMPRPATRALPAPTRAAAPRADMQVSVTTSPTGQSVVSISPRSQQRQAVSPSRSPVRSPVSDMRRASPHAAPAESGVEVSVAPSVDGGTVVQVSSPQRSPPGSAAHPPPVEVIVPPPAARGATRRLSGMKKPTVRTTASAAGGVQVTVSSESTAAPAGEYQRPSSGAPPGSVQTTKLRMSGIVRPGLKKPAQPAKAAPAIAPRASPGSPEHQPVPPGHYVMPTKGTGPAITLSSPRDLRPKLAKYTPSSLNAFRNVTENPFVMKPGPLRQVHGDVRSGNFRVYPHRADQVRETSFRGNMFEERLDPRLPREAWSQSLREAEEFAAEGSDDEDEDEDEEEKEEEAAAPGETVNVEFSQPGEAEPVLSLSITAVASPKAGTPKTEQEAEQNQLEQTVKRLVNEETEDFLASTTPPFGVVSPKTPLSQKVDRIKKGPDTNRLLNESLERSKLGEDGSEQPTAEMVASMIAGEEQGIVKTSSSPRRTYETLFPALPDEPVVTTSPAAPVPLQDIIVPTVEREEEAQVVTLEAADITQEAVADEEQPDLPNGSAFSEAMTEPITSPATTKAEVPPPAPVPEEMADAKPLPSQGARRGALEDQRPPWEINVAWLEQLAGGHIGGGSPRRSDEPINPTPDGLLEFVIETGQPSHRSRVRLRGTRPPHWFPGYFSVLPHVEGFVREEVCPTSAMASAWSVLAPATLRDSSDIIVP